MLPVTYAHIMDIIEILAIISEYIFFFCSINAVDYV